MPVLKGTSDGGIIGKKKGGEGKSEKDPLSAAGACPALRLRFGRRRGIRDESRAYAGSHSDTDSHSNTDTNAHSNTDTKARSDSDTKARSDSDTYTYTYSPAA